MIRKPLKVLVCLLFVATVAVTGSSWGYNSEAGAGVTGVEADALSADTRSRSIQPAVRPSYVPPAQSTRSSGQKSSSGHSSSSTQFPRHTTGNPSSGSSYHSYPRYGGQQLPQYTYDPPQPDYSAAMDLVPPLFNQIMPFSPLRAIGFRGLACDAYLPKPGCKQFVLTAKLWHMKLNSSTQVWLTNGVGGPGTELDLHRDLGLDKHRYIPEYEISYHIRQNWAIKYSFMPIQLQANENVPTFGGFWFGNQFFPQFAPVFTKWNRYINRWDLNYDWYNAPHAVSTIFAGFALYDEHLSVAMGPVFLRTRSRNLHLAYAGMTLEKIVRTVGGGAAVSLHCKWSWQFLESNFGWDGQITSRVSVPMDCGRYGFLELGWRWIVLRRDENTDVDKTNLDGLMGSAGLIF